LTQKGAICISWNDFKERVMTLSPATPHIGAELTKETRHALASKLGAAGLRVTEPRLRLAHLLFRHGDRHVTAEALRDEAQASGLKVSQATVYNTLNQFQAAGLLRQVQVDQARSYFDTNIDMHHHFYVEQEARLIDIAANAVEVARLPDSPKGYDVDRVEVIIRLDKADSTSDKP
jgi:Fur family transcriptional regulator, iron response regulator